jgi:large subunit ribosomal protein L22
MQEATAYGKHIRIAPRKVQLVIDLIRGKAVGEAIAILRIHPDSIANHRKDTKLAIANAEHNFSLDPNKL